jgi:NAD(P)-dependent dehydrogenase (short-subunit alcohol dehydrogenase family)
MNEEPSLLENRIRLSVLSFTLRGMENVLGVKCAEKKVSCSAYVSWYDQGFPGGSAYVSTKFAIEGLSKSMAYELEPFGIKVVLVEPGVIRTNFVNAIVAAKNLKIRILHIHK